MKLSKTTQWILIVGIFAILLVAAGVAYGRQVTKQGQLRSDIAQAQQNFITYSEQRNNSEANLSQAQSQIANVQDELRRYTESLEINEALFEAASDANVTITKLNSSPPDDEELNGINYRLFSLRITAEGEVVALLNFSRNVSETFSTASITSTRVYVPEAGEDESKQKPTIDLGLTIYFL